VVGRDGVTTDPEKVRAVRDWAVPVDLPELWAFLVSRVADPVDSQDAVTKKYVDNVKERVKNTAMTLIQNPGKRLIISTEDGNVVDSDSSVEDIIKKNVISEFSYSQATIIGQR